MLVDEPPCLVDRQSLTTRDLHVRRRRFVRLGVADLAGGDQRPAPAVRLDDAVGLECLVGLGNRVDGEPEFRRELAHGRQLAAGSQRPG